MEKVKNILKKIMTEYKVIFLVLILSVTLSLVSPYFLTSRNILNVLRQVCVNTIAASGLVLILGAGGIDLSLGSTVGLVGVIVAFMMKAGVPVWLACILGIAFGAFLGAINGFFITRFNLLPFVVTLSTQQIYRGAIYLLTGMQPIIALPDSFMVIGQGYVGQIPIPVFIMLGMIILMSIVAYRTKFGRYILAIGGNKEAARVSGVNVQKITWMAYIMMGAVAALASLVMTSRTASAQVSAGTNMEMDIIAGAVIGGTSMSGGVCNVFGALFGCILVGLVSNGLNLLGVDANWQVVMKGVLILAAVLIDTLSSKVSMKKA